jgi:peroxiredoxin
LRENYDKFLEKDTKIIIIGPEDKEAFKKYWIKEKLKFIGLPDPDKKILKLYGQEVKLLKLGRMPAQFLVDKSGFIRFVHYGKSMSDIASIDDVLKVLNKRGGVT